MFQNIKVDIIYYKTNADFELEFNLCGCCRMRLLTDKSPDKKTMIHALSRAVSRSRVIMIAGKLFGDDGIIELVSHAIAKPLNAIDNKLYGINSEEKVEIINGATPLVTPEGYFGGCIIESGPQSMVLLSDNKPIRKSIMNTLIHPYVEELCAMELKAKAAAASVEPDTESEQEGDNAAEAIDSSADASVEITPPEEPELPITAEIVPDPDPDPEIKTEPIPTEKPEIEEEPDPYILNDTVVKSVTPETDAAINAAADDGVDLSGGMIFETDEYHAGGKKKKKKEADYSDYEGYDDELQKSLSDYMTENENDQDDTPHRLFTSLNIPILIISLLLLVISAVLCYCIFYIPASKGIAPTDYLRDTFKTLFG